MNKKILIVILGISLSVLTNTTHAEFVNKNDCSLVLNGVDKAYTVIKAGITPTSLIDEKTIKQALQNLSNYCNGKVGGAESYFIFDQLIDLGFRKLDAYSDATLRYNLDADIKGAARQKLVTDFADPTKNAKPEQVIQAFNIYRPGSEQPGASYQPTSTCNITNIDSLSLRGRYRAVCEIAKCISKQNPLVTENVSDESSASKMGTMPEICTAENGIVQSRFLSESSYIKQLLARVGIRTITNVIQQYTQNYFVGNRRQNLYEEFTKFDQYLSIVSHKIQEGTPVCSGK